MPATGRGMAPVQVVVEDKPTAASVPNKLQVPHTLDSLAVLAVLEVVPDWGMQGVGVPQD